LPRTGRLAAPNVAQKNGRYRIRDGAKYRAKRAKADANLQAGMTKNLKITRKVTEAEMKKPPEGG
jgi:hypothetical protein